MFKDRVSPTADPFTFDTKYFCKCIESAVLLFERKFDLEMSNKWRHLL